MSRRREFKQAVKIEIVRRATWSDGHVMRDQYCEKCRQPTKGRFEIDHRDPDAMQIDKSKPLTAAEGWLLCIPCHDEKTSKDVADIAKAKRREAAHLGAGKPGKAPIPQPPKAPRSTTKLDSIRALGGPGISRLGFVSIGEVATNVLAKIKGAAE